MLILNSHPNRCHESHPLHARPPSPSSPLRWRPCLPMIMSHDNESPYAEEGSNPNEHNILEKTVAVTQNE
ncbi:hypothetical protein ABZP36_028074 [Zizania latifolia]